MSGYWRFLSLAGTLLVAAMAIAFIWADSVPEVLGKAFATVVVAGLGLLVLQSALFPPRPKSD
ncbi:MAG: hypothetical protein AAGJ29_03380 [Pseudomonadota bacterium]